jgi:hypothetical protein
MKVLTISGAGCGAILLMSVAASAGGSSQHTVLSAPAPHSESVPNTTTYRPYSYVPTAPQNPYAAGGSSSQRVEPYAVPALPQNPYPSSATRGPMSPAQNAMPVAATDTYSAPPSYSFRCVINQAGDYCTGASASPVSAGIPCTCDKYNGYTR